MLFSYSAGMQVSRSWVSDNTECIPIDRDAVYAGATIDDKPHLKAWFEKIAARPAVQRGLDVPDVNKFKTMSEEEMKKTIAETQKFMGSTAPGGSQK